MIKLFFLLVCSVTLFALNPKIYSALGDVIYNDANAIEKLQKVEAFEAYTPRIKQYIKDVKKVKRIGFSIENRTANIDKKVYLEKLRTLAKTDDLFKRKVDDFFHQAIQEQDNKLFDAMINSSLLNTQEYKEEIIGYYFKHADALPKRGLIQKYLDEDAKLKAKHKPKKRYKKSKKQREKERIERLRRLDRLKQERLEKSLQEQLRKKKEKIIEYQKKELSKTI